MSFLFESQAYGSYCASCTYLGTEVDGGKYYCSSKGKWVKASDPKCSNQVYAYSRSDDARANMYESSSSSGCYLTTIMCKILKYPDDNYYLNTLRAFRDNTMKKNIKYIPLLITYDTVGPIISYQLNFDKDRKEIASTFFNLYITKAVDAIKEGKTDEAINIYKAMTYELAKRYNINIDLISPRKEKIDMATLGHARTKTPAK